MKKTIILFTIVVIAVFIASLFTTENFDRTVVFKTSTNPLWDDQKKPLQSSLTQALAKEGFSFQTGRGTEADPDGICFGDFASDEYWVIQYFADKHEVHAYAWIIGINWIGQQSASQRFSRLEETLRAHLTR